ncbi:alpha/beta fold hydrolase [Nocardioides sp.]|uniref:alpha/beta fold hydrolase n=1 Tax=Nocardioides sp. TaxID=35761 RepID=UPI003D0BE0D8
MSSRRRIVEIAAGAAGIAVAGAALKVAHDSRVIARRGLGDATRLGSLRSDPHTVVADDGVPLHVEVDPAEDTPSTGRRRGAKRRTQPPTLVFVHGYALNLDCWHFQRAAYRGLIRTVFYDQRSHGRSGRSSARNATIEDLGIDLLRIIEHEVPEGPVVLIGHSMGGMSIMSLAEQHPYLFGTKVVGVALIATTAGGLNPQRLFLPLLPSSVGGPVGLRLVAGLARGARAVDRLRQVGHGVAMVATDRYAFGDKVPATYVEFVDQMLSGTPFEVLAEFFPSFGSLDKYAVLTALGEVPTSIICGTADRITPIELSHRLNEVVPGSSMLECDGAGHMVILERHEQVNAALDQLIAAAQEHEAVGPA